MPPHPWPLPGQPSTPESETFLDIVTDVITVSLETDLPRGRIAGVWAPHSLGTLSTKFEPLLEPWGQGGGPVTLLLGPHREFLIHGSQEGPDNFFPNSQATPMLPA